MKVVSCLLNSYLANERTAAFTLAAPYSSAQFPGLAPAIYRKAPMRIQNLLSPPSLRRKSNRRDHLCGYSAWKFIER